MLPDDAVNSPSHYKLGGKLEGLETIDIIESLGFGFNLGNLLKYIARAGKKFDQPTLQDLRKARYYLDREIANRGGDECLSTSTPNAS